MALAGATMKRMVKEYGPAAGMVYVQVAYGGMFLLSRIAFTRGMSHFAFVFYRQCIASIFIYSAQYFCQDPRDRKLSIRWRSMQQIFLLSLLGISVSQNLYYAGLSLTSSTFASSMNNLQPIVTFLLAYFLGMEEVRIRTRTGQAKVLGTAMCVLGAMAMTFSKTHQNGAEEGGGGLHSSHIMMMISRVLLVLRGDGGDGGADALVRVGGGDGFITGALLTCVGSWSFSIFLICQAWIVDEYPSQLTLSGHVSFVGSLQCAAVALIFEKPAALIIRWDFLLLTILYGGIVATGMGFFLIMWCVKERGPVFTTAFNPLSSVLVASLEPFLLHLHLTWTSYGGMVIIFAGLYLVLWGKAQERTMPIAAASSPSATTAAAAAAVSASEITGQRGGEHVDEASNQQPLLPKTTSYS